MRIPSELLETLTAVVAEGTFEQAARVLRVTPSAVSQRIKALEQRLGRVLVVRTKPVAVTEAGEAVLRLGQQLAVLERETLRELGAEPASERPPVVPIAVNADSLSTWILPALARVAEREHLVLDLVRDDQDHTARLLAAGTVMAAVASDAVPVAGCTSTPLGRMRYRAFATPAYVRRWFPEGVTASALERAPLIDLDRKDHLQVRFARRLARRAVDPPRHYVPATADFAMAVRLGIGWAMLPAAHADEAEAAGEIVDLAPGRHLDVPLHWQQWDLRSSLVDAIAAEVRAEADRVLS
ncbi:LysR family transcriptional regulator ArgP [Homoserinibacter sp. YIM 151385]|uniref:LysR family transcriptional regulator ArgP n=1 Tax=Homoserinibacter sp. YIM 151385 TaxID=2985506 RepID=UPI0022F06281|nr:LysR family transcriptional regulator ArgP [Homoserinibacter sp. YIM 151385]WBU36950.1 LysR family transcriptional regulator ArgP [Homoserinibacter sp. YIM 151385]